MDALRIHIKSWTASFRYPTFISGFQPTLPCPPLTTTYGLISAAKGDIVGPDDVRIGYVFRSEGKGVDLELLYELSPGLKAKTNIIRREFLYNPELYLYIDNLTYRKFFERPHYPLLLGRSSDLAYVAEIKKITLESIKNAKLGGTILPYDLKEATGIFQALPTRFTETIPRKAEQVKPYILVEDFFTYPDPCLYDAEKSWGIWFYGKET